MERILQARMEEASQLASENMALIESIADPALTVALSFGPCVAKVQVGEMDDVLRWSQTMVDVAESCTVSEIFILGSPLAMHLAFSAVAKWSIGHRGWREDMQRAIAISRESDACVTCSGRRLLLHRIVRGVLLVTDAIFGRNRRGHGRWPRSRRRTSHSS